MSDRQVIVWDLDLTLGDFAALDRREEAAGPVPLRLRPGMAEALGALAAAGFRHAVLTLASPRYAETALRGTGLRDYFELVEGLGQRAKGDAAGVGADLGVGEAERPHRMLFVGDHPLFDAPQDPRVLFHLEPFALSRPAADLVRLVLHLRDVGGGSLRSGFDRLIRRRAGWSRLWPLRSRIPWDRPVRRFVPGVGDLLLLACRERCPVIGFENRPEPGAPPAEFPVVPAEVTVGVHLDPGPREPIG